MGKSLVAESVELDGVMEDPGGAAQSEHGGWRFPFWNGEIARYKRDGLFASDALLPGRVPWEGFAAVGPSITEEDGFADRMNSLPNTLFQ